MTLELLNKAQLQILNRRSSLGYPLATAEKDYFLALVLKVLYESPLGEKLVFKGGTALHHTYLPQLRFSEDLDFTAISAITLEEIGGILSAHDFLDVKESRVSDFTIKINRLKYAGPLGNPNSLKVEIDSAEIHVAELGNCKTGEGRRRRHHRLHEGRIERRHPQGDQRHRAFRN